MTPSSRKRLPALDGLRAVAILAIVAYHLNLPFLPSGHLGVCMFLVLTGYLVTSSLMRAYAKEHEVDRVSYLRKRFVRIWPSVALAALATACVCLVLNRVLFTKLKPDLAPSLLYALNWSYVLRDVSYFDALGTPSPLLHLWYIALSEQFVLVWALVAPALFKRGRRAGMAVTLLLAVASAVAMALLYVPDADPSRIYYGTDTRAFSLLIGAALAYVWPAWRKAPFSARAKRAEGGSPRAAALAVSVLGALALVGLVVAMVLLPADSPLLYRGGMAVASLLAAFVIAGAHVRGGIVDRVLGAGPVAAFGERAFGLYLWHYPVICLLGAAQAKAAWWVKPAAVLASLALAELSYRLLERRGEGGEQPLALRTRPAQAVSAICVLALAGYAGWGVFTAQDEFLVPQDAIKSTGVSAGEAATIEKKPTQIEEPEASEASEPVEASAPVESAQEPESAPEPEPDPEPLPETIATITAAPDELEAGLYDPVLIGDSVPGDSTLPQLFPNGIVDTYIGRRPLQAIEVYRGYAEQGVVGNTVIFASFSNTTPYPDQLDDLVATVGPDKTIYLVGIVEPYGFQDEANANLAACAEKYDNVHFIDWAALCSGNEGVWLYADGTHLTPTGAPYYVQMIAHAVAESMRAYGATVS